MAALCSKLSELLAKIVGKPHDGSLQSSHPEAAAEKVLPRTSDPPKETSEKTLPPVTKATPAENHRVNERDPYFFQIGFDFGTSSSKAVIRDINTNRAWAYAVPFATGHSNNFLIPSVVIYNNGIFERHHDTNILYPERGLYHLKMAMEKVALEKLDAPIFSEYNKILGPNSPYRPIQIARLASIFFLATAFSEIIKSIIKKFPDFGGNQEDQIAINMAIPVANISDNKIHSFFETTLNIAWHLAKGLDMCQQRLSVNELLQRMETLSSIFKGQKTNDICHVYPEVSANVQAFIRSPASSPDIRTIYFFSDIGAGTVDQSVFTYAGRKDERLLNYFAANVFPRGSSQIERAACGDVINEDNLEYWRKEKERKSNAPKLNYAKMKVGEALKSDSDKTLRGTLKCLPHGCDGITPGNTLKEHMKFIFSGGGYTEVPYQRAVIDAYKKALNLDRDPILTSIARPTDLDIPIGKESWINRLYVAYGLSFLFQELAKNTFPSENELDNSYEISTLQVNYCTCGGRNKNCVKCYGRGII